MFFWPKAITLQIYRSKIKNSKMGNNSNRITQGVIGGLAIILLIAGLFVDNIYLAWLIIGLLFADALYLVVSRGWRWWKGKHNRIALRERFLLFLSSLMFLFLIQF